ncbi:hypothetical protein C6P42_001477 [Pichia californica]|nr:hypothetical protein C6P42_001477 [[Candida] californica]
MKLSTIAIIAASIVSSVNAESTSYVARTYSAYSPSASQIAKDAANATTLQWTTDVKGKTFDRFVVIWLENTDFDQAAEEEDMAWVASHGITLTNYWAVTHPSEPNYISSVSGDYFSLDDDRFITLPKNISTLADLLDDKGISFGSYQQHMPYTGFQGFNYSNQETFANDYMRKHNPFMSFESYTSNATRMSVMKNFTEFEKDLNDEKLPQYCIITPNMTNDAHDSNIRVAGKWTRDFMTPLLSNEYFMNNTLVLITFDENETYGDQNTVFSILLGGALDDSLKGTTDNTFYDHYTQIASAEVNWDLYNLGRNDVTANIWNSLAQDAGISNKDVDTRYMVNNETYVGYLLDDQIAVPAPNVSATNIAGKGILPAISSVWASEFSAQSKAGYFTSTTTLNTDIGIITNAASVFASEYASSTLSSVKISSAATTTTTTTSEASSAASTASTASTSKAASSSSAVASSSKAGAAQVAPVAGASVAAVLLAAFLM